MPNKKHPIFYRDYSYGQGLKKNLIDIRGRKVPRSDSITFNGKIYDKRRSNPPDVVYNKNTGDYELYDKNCHILEEGVYYNKYYMIYYIDKNNKKLKFRTIDGLYNHINNGYTYENLLVGKKDNDTWFFENYSIANSHNFYECYNSSKLKHYTKYDEKKELAKFKSANYNQFNNAVYNPRDTSIPKKLGMKSATFIGTGGLRYTYGVEIETIRGRVSSALCRSENLNLTCVRDGSLKDEDGEVRGGEYVTGVLKGDSGLSNLHKSVKIISQRCMIDSRCGIHVHIGSFKATDQFTVLAYILALKVQREVLECFPPSRKNNNYASFLQEENYQQILRDQGLKYGVDIAYNDLFLKLANADESKAKYGIPKREIGNELNKYLRHPGRRYTDKYAYNIPSNELYRYKWLNFITCNFNQRSAQIREGELNKGIPFTLEFRCHSASTNYFKIRNWILFCMCFVNFVENQADYIINTDNITMEDIINMTLPKNEKLKTRLNTFYSERKLRFAGKHAAANEELEYSEVPDFKQNKLKDLI